MKRAVTGEETKLLRRNICPDCLKSNFKRLPSLTLAADHKCLNCGAIFGFSSDLYTQFWRVSPEQLKTRILKREALAKRHA